MRCRAAPEAGLGWAGREGRGVKVGARPGAKTGTGMGAYRRGGANMYLDTGLGRGVMRWEAMACGRIFGKDTAHCSCLEGVFSACDRVCVNHPQWQAGREGERDGRDGRDGREGRKGEVLLWGRGGTCPGGGNMSVTRTASTYLWRARPTSDDGSRRKGGPGHPPTSVAATGRGPEETAS